MHPYTSKNAVSSTQCCSVTFSVSALVSLSFWASSPFSLLKVFFSCCFLLVYFQAWLCANCNRSLSQNHDLSQDLLLEARTPGFLETLNSCWQHNPKKCLNLSTTSSLVMGQNHKKLVLRQNNNPGHEDQGGPSISSCFS